MSAENDDDRTYILSVSVSGPVVDHAQYHRGCGWDSVLGMGSTPREALEDALEQLAQREEVLLCDEPTAEESFGSDADRYLVEEVVAEEDQTPRYWLEHSSATGCHLVTSQNATRHDSREAALRELRETVARLQLRGFGILPEPSFETIETTEYEVLEPWGCGMIPEEVGVVRVVDDEEECERENERRREGCELNVYIELELETCGPEDYSLEGVPDESDIAGSDVVRDRAEVLGRAAFERSGSHTGRSWTELDGRARQSWVDMERKRLAERIRGILATAEDSRKGRLEALEVAATLLGTGVQHYGVPDDVTNADRTCAEVSAGETYASTILLVNGDRFEVGSWGGWYEEAEEEYSAESGEQRCPYCGEWTEGVPTREQTFCRPGYEVPPATGGVEVVVKSRAGGSTFGVASGPADKVRRWLDDMAPPMATIPGTREDGSAEWRPRGTIVLQRIDAGEDPAGVAFDAGSVIVGEEGWDTRLAPEGRPILCGCCGNVVLS